MGISPVQQLFNVDAVVPSANRQLDPETVQQAVTAVNNAHALGDANELTFSIDPDTNKLLIRLVDKDTHQVVRQIPAEYLLRLARQLRTK